MNRLIKISASILLAVFAAKEAIAYCIPAPRGACVEAQRAIARMDSLSSDNVTNYSNLICGLVDAGIWSKLDAIYILATDNIYSAFNNLKSSNFPLTQVGTGDFAAGIGWAGDGATGYLTTGFNPATVAGNYSLNSASLVVVVGSDRTFQGDYAVIGSQFASGSVVDYIKPKAGAGPWAIATAGANISGGTSWVSPVNSGSAQGTWVLSRTNSTTQTLYKNGVQFGVNTTNTAVNLANRSMLIGAAYNVGAVAFYSPDTISAAAFGSGLTAGEVATLSTLLQPFANKTSNVPLSLARWGYTQNIFSSNSFTTSNVDINRTGLPGYQWYLQPPWYLTDALSTSRVGDVWLTDGVLGLKSSAQDSRYPQVLTAVHDNTGTSWIGTTFPPGGYYESCFYADQTLNTSWPGMWPAFWLADVSMFIAQSNWVHGAQNGAGMELDVTELTPANGTFNYLMNIHDWTVTAGDRLDQYSRNAGIDVANSGLNVSNIIKGGSSPNFNINTCYGLLWVPSFRNSGTGRFERYINRVHIPAIDLTCTKTTSSTFGTLTPGESPVTIGAFCRYEDTFNGTMMFGGGQPVATYVTSVNVWRWAP